MKEKFLIKFVVDNLVMQIQIQLNQVIMNEL
jgi:hypothetical protein